MLWLLLIVPFAVAAIIFASALADWIPEQYQKLSWNRAVKNLRQQVKKNQDPFAAEEIINVWGYGMFQFVIATTSAVHTIHMNLPETIGDTIGQNYDTRADPNKLQIVYGQSVLNPIIYTGVFIGIEYRGEDGKFFLMTNRSDAKIKEIHKFENLIDYRPPATTPKEKTIESLKEMSRDPLERQWTLKYRA